VRADADLEYAVGQLVDGAFFNSGQSCCGIGRIYVHESLHARFLEAFVALTCRYRLGNPVDRETTLGPVVRTEAAQSIRGAIRGAVRAGARALIDSRRFEADAEGTPYLAPQVLVDVDHSMPIAREEVFGPLVSIMRVRSDEEAIGLMNDSPYGLTASVWTHDESTALAIGDRIETGTWFMNRCDYLDPALAWVGVRESGRGCTLSVVGYEHLTRPKSFHLRTRV
jgi:acyl-CoA reductase-like NAD-dependent aldehyde dehydrogenase